MHAARPESISAAKGTERYPPRPIGCSSAAANPSIGKLLFAAEAGRTASLSWSCCGQRSRQPPAAAAQSSRSCCAIAPKGPSHPRRVVFAAACSLCLPRPPPSSPDCKLCAVGACLHQPQQWRDPSCTNRRPARCGARCCWAVPAAAAAAGRPREEAHATSFNSWPLQADLSYSYWAANAAAEAPPPEPKVSAGMLVACCPARKAHSLCRACVLQEPFDSPFQVQLTSTHQSCETPCCRS